MTPTDERLRDALLAWRHEQALKRFGPFVVNSFGAKIILSDEVLGRLVACAQAFKLSIVPDITRETGWAKEKSWVDDLGDSLLQLIHEYYPLPLPEPLLDLDTTAAPGAPRKRGQVKCRSCGTLGHNSTYLATRFRTHN